MASRPTLTAVTMPANIITVRSVCVRPVLVLLFFSVPLIAQAIPTNMGSFTPATTTTSSTGSTSGSYTTSAGATGTFTITRNESNGYDSTAEFIAGNNGIMIRNQANAATDRDKFKYTITITPTDKNSIHTIKIAQTSYSAGGNSEVARQTLNYTDFATNEQIDFPASATVLENPSVSYFHGAMGDYFMGQKLNANSFSSNNPISAPQLRVNSSDSLYYYALTTLNGSGNSSSFTPTTTGGNVSFAANQKRGTLPTPASFENILKSTANPNTYPPLSVNAPIANGGRYVSYGIVNSDSNYVIAVQNAKTVSLTYEGIMNGSSALSTDAIGETYNEWISFGVESTPIYTFSGTVYNDNGGITDIQADASNANITTGAYNNVNYFNGVFENNIETGITGSTVSLADRCENPNTVYSTQNLTSASASEIGKYQFRVAPSLLNNQRSVCIIETNISSTHPIRTTSSTKLVTLSNDTYAYNDQNFGRVSTKNVALVLEKEQAANNCKFTDFTRLTYSKNALSSSTTGAGVDVKPGQCIAYKITATNRSNVSVDDFVMQDTLQKKNPNDPAAPKVTSVLTDPIRAAGDFNDGLVTGQNGTIRTKALIIPKRTKRYFYFNTQYGSTQSN